MTSGTTDWDPPAPSDLAHVPLPSDSVGAQGAECELCGAGLKVRAQGCLWRVHPCPAEFCVPSPGCVRLPGVRRLPPPSCQWDLPAELSAGCFRGACFRLCLGKYPSNPREEAEKLSSSPVVTELQPARRMEGRVPGPSTGACALHQSLATGAGLRGAPTPSSCVPRAPRDRAPAPALQVGPRWAHPMVWMGSWEHVELRTV